MTKNGIVLSVIALLLAALYAYFFTDWFDKETIQIIPQIRPGRASSIRRDPNSSPVCPVSFLLRGKYRLTCVKVVAASDLATNKYPAALWHMVSDSNSPPTRSFLYGERIRGMKPAVAGARPESLQADVPYVLIVEAGNVKGQTNFHTRELVQPTQ